MLAIYTWLKKYWIGRVLIWECKIFYQFYRPGTHPNRPSKQFFFWCWNVLLKLWFFLYEIPLWIEPDKPEMRESSWRLKILELWKRNYTDNASCKDSKIQVKGIFIFSHLITRNQGSLLCISELLNWNLPTKRTFKRLWSEPLISAFHCKLSETLWNAKFCKGISKNPSKVEKENISNESRRLCNVEALV